MYFILTSQLFMSKISRKQMQSKYDKENIENTVF